MIHRRGGILLLAAALILMGTAAVLFWQVDPEPAVPDGTPWNFYLAGMVALIGGILLLTAAPIKLEKPPFLLLLILLLALVVRLYRFPDAPYGVWGDEAEAGLNARQMLHNSSFRPVYNGSLHMTYIQMWMYAGLLSIFGETSVLALRVLSVLFGVSTVFLGYGVGKQIHSVSFGLWMAFFLAIMRWSITFSRLAITGIETPFFALLTLYFLLRLKQKTTLWNAALLG
ncbi:MAG: glycosyltransferase family 39 protein, partial [Anaerolineae bacterium]|nr:glycosyltransferase family 39 protein [Anaerolineae bacterium]